MLKFFIASNYSEREEIIKKNNFQEMLLIFCEDFSNAIIIVKFFFN